MFKKCSTDQRFIGKRNTTYKIHTFGPRKAVQTFKFPLFYAFTVLRHLDLCLKLCMGGVLENTTFTHRYNINITNTKGLHISRIITLLGTLGLCSRSLRSLQALLDFCSFRFTAVYDSILFSSPLVLLTK